jgi:cell division septum initiation protein DivIVA
VNIVIPIGNSYLDRENKKINTRLDRLEQKVGGATIIERTIDKKGVVRSISISQGQLAVSGEF